VKLLNSAAFEKVSRYGSCTSSVFPASTGGHSRCDNHHQSRYTRTRRQKPFTGVTALFFAGQESKVTGIDFLEEPILRAKRKAAEQGLSVTFLVKDALTLKDWSERFDNMIDSGLFHVFSDEDRTKDVAGLATILKPDGRVSLMWFSDEEPGTQGPRRVSKKELRCLHSGMERRVHSAIQGRGPARLQGVQFQRERAESVVGRGAKGGVRPVDHLTA
jgi:SAM-dependent methyltransferase